MIDLQKHEQFEMEVLKLLSDNQLLNALIFGGGTCLRLCFGLNRYSVDLDFWCRKNADDLFFSKLKTVLESKYQVTDHHEKHFLFLSEIGSSSYPRKLKIEIRKRMESQKVTDLNIAFSPFASNQVRLLTFTLSQMWENKIQAFLERKAIRDAFDLEFLYKKGDRKQLLTHLSPETRQQIIDSLDAFKPKDFKVTLGSLIENEERAYYVENGFNVLRNGLM